MRRTFQAEEAGYHIQAELQCIGNDVLIMITGGDVPHIGTVTTFSQEAGSQIVQFPSHSGRKHKDEVLAEVILHQIAPLIQGTCVITAGVHVNRISQIQIAAATTMTQQLAAELYHWLQQHPQHAEPAVYYSDNQNSK